jgi:hypothetical protein
MGFILSEPHLSREERERRLAQACLEHDERARQEEEDWERMRAQLLDLDPPQPLQPRLRLVWVNPKYE